MRVAWLCTFLHEVCSLGIEEALPQAVLMRLRQNLADNQLRSADLFAEFTALNRAFQQAGVLYSNLKGFTLSPESCPDPVLRCQLDLDFLVDIRHLKTCQEILARTDYQLTAATEKVWEFKAGSSELVSIADHYKARSQRSVELHFAASPNGARSSTGDERLDRLRLHSWGGVAFPALSLGDLFVGQAVHIFGHVRSACTRLAWLLEYQRHLLTRYNDEDFWREVEDCAQTQRDASNAIGLATLLSSRIFGASAPSRLDRWTLERLPASVRRWADYYGRKAMLANFPGTKLYLFLEEELVYGESAWKIKRRSSLLPLHRVPTIVYPGPNDNFVKWLRRQVYQARFVIFRLRFHVVEGARYVIEAARWRRRVAALKEGPVYKVRTRASSSKSVEL